MSTPSPEAPRQALPPRRLPRLIALTAVCAVLAVFVLPLAARQLIGPARLKAITEQTLTDALGRRVKITGDVSILFVPWFGLAMGPVTVAEAPGFGDAPMLSARRLEMTIRVLPLLRRVVSPGSVRVRDLSLRLRRDASGRTNWEDLAAPRQTAATEAPGWEVMPEPRDIQVENASLSYLDEATGRSFAITQTHLKTGVGQPFDFSLAFRAEGFVPGGQLDCHARGKASFDPATGRLGLHKTLVESGLTFTRPLSPGGATPTRLVSRFALDYDPAAQTLAVTDLDARLPDARLSGSATVTHLPGDPHLNTRLTLDLGTVGKWRDILGLSPGESPGSLVATGPSGNGAEPAPTGDTPAELTAEARPEAGQMVVTVAATAGSTGLRVSEASLTLPQGRLTAAGSLTFGQTPRLDATVTATDMDFDALPRPVGSATWRWPATWPGLWPGKGAMDARIELHHCRLAGLDVADAHATLSGDKGLLRLYPLSLVLPGGVVSADARFDAGPDRDHPDAPASLGLDARAVIAPTPGPAEPAIPPSRMRLLGRLRAEGARGTLLVATPDPNRAAAVLGLADLVPLATPLEAKGVVTLTPGVDRLIAKAVLTGLEAKVAGTVLHGQIVYNAGEDGLLGFDLAADSLDLDQLGAFSGGGGGSGDQSPGIRAEGKLRLEHVVLRGAQAKNVSLGLTLGDGRAEGTVAGGELFGGKLSGKIEADPSGRLTGSLQLAGAEAARLTGLFGSQSLSGPVTAKATLEARKNATGRLDNLAATIEAEASQLRLGTSGTKQVLTSPKAVLTVKRRDAAAGSPDALDLDASLAVNLASGFGLREVRLTAAGPLAVDASGHLREPGPIKLEAAALLRPTDSGKAVKLALAGPITPDGAGGFSTGDMRLEAGGVPAALKLWRKGPETAPVNFSLETGPLAPRRALTDWGLALPSDMPPDRLAKGSLALSGTATGQGLDVKRLALTVDETTVTGSLTMPGFDPRRGKWDLTVDRLDFDAYFPRPPASGPPPLAERRKPLDLTLLRALSLETRLSLGWFKKGNVTFGPSTIVANAKGGQFTYRQESPRFYGGRFFAEIRGDARDVALKTLVELKLESIEIARFLWDWAEGNTLDSGSATFILAARTSGVSEMELRDNLAGNASLQITRGSLKVREPAGKTGEAPKSEPLPFDVFSSSWLAKGGVAHSDDFLIESPRMRVTGKGFVDLRDETINLSLGAALTGGGQVPATIIGPLDGPKLTIDRSKLLGDMVYRVLQGIVSIPGKAVTRILQIR